MINSPTDALKESQANSNEEGNENCVQTSPKPNEPLQEAAALAAQHLHSKIIDDAYASFEKIFQIKQNLEAGNIKQKGLAPEDFKISPEDLEKVAELAKEYGDQLQNMLGFPKLFRDDDDDDNDNDDNKESDEDFSSSSSYRSSDSNSNSKSNHVGYQKGNNFWDEEGN